MADDFYKLMKIYEDYNVPGNQSRFSGNVGSYAGSYNQPAANGPGHEPVHPTGGNPSTGEIVEFPGKGELTPNQMLEIMEELAEELIERAHAQHADKSHDKLKSIYNQLMDLRMHEYNED